MTDKTILITGAGAGLGQEVAIRLALLGYRVIATVETEEQTPALVAAARDRGARLHVEKLDVTNPADRELAWQRPIDILLSNAGVSEGGSLVDIPEHNLRRQFEINVFGLLLTAQGFARQFAARRSGLLVFMSSMVGMVTDPFSGAYSASKRAVEAFADALYKELREFNVQVATINPGPFDTGFNERTFTRWTTWDDNPTQRLFDYEKMTFPYSQYDPQLAVQTIIDVVTGARQMYRNVTPSGIEAQIHEEMFNVWTRKRTDGLGIRHPAVERAYLLGAQAN